MHDPILERIWRAREELLKKHGGFEGVFKHVQNIERAQRARLQRKRKKAAAKRPAASR